jgi:hypothetical protein
MDPGILLFPDFCNEFEDVVGYEVVPADYVRRSGLSEARRLFWQPVKLRCCPKLLVLIGRLMSLEIAQLVSPPLDARFSSKLTPCVILQDSHA